MRCDVERPPPPPPPTPSDARWRLTWPSRVGPPRVGPADRRPTERAAVWSLACSIIGFVFGLAAVAGIVLGFRARRNIIRAEGAVKGAQVALAGIIAGFGAIAFLTTLALVGAFGGHPTSDAALAQSELILPSQYPHGFVGRGPGTNVTQASYFSSWGPHIVRCLYMSTADVDPHPVETGSQEWDRGTAWVNDTIDVFPTAATAHTDETAAVNPNALSCAFRSWGPRSTRRSDPVSGQESTTTRRSPLA
jgi:hypothetical protein